MNCNKCGAPMRESRQGKMYCSELCWKNPDVKQANKAERKFVNDINADIKQQQIEKAIVQKNDNINWHNAKNNATQIVAASIYGKKDVTPKWVKESVEALANWYYNLEPSKETTYEPIGEELPNAYDKKDEDTIDLNSIPF